MKAGIIAASTAFAAFFMQSGHHHRCDKLFTVKMGERAGRATYAGTGGVPPKKLRVLGYIERCERNPMAQGFVRWYDHRQRMLWLRRKLIAATPYSVVASYYHDGGSTACAFHATYGVANLTLPCGTKVSFRFGAATVTAEVDDRGPYVGGRQYDLDDNTKAALGCPDMCGGAYTGTPLYASRPG